MTINDNYHAVAIRACDFNMIGSDECQGVAAKIHTGEMSKWHFAWLIPAEIVCNLGAILLSVVSALAHVIMGVALTIFAACTGDAEKKLQYNLRAAEHFASSLSAITDKVGTSFVRLVMPKTAAYSCVKAKIFSSLSKGHLKNFHFEQIASQIRTRIQQSPFLDAVPTHLIDSLLHHYFDIFIEIVIDRGTIEDLQDLQEDLQNMLPVVYRQLAGAFNVPESLLSEEVQTGMPQVPHGGTPNWGGFPPVRPEQNQPAHVGPQGLGVPGFPGIAQMPPQGFPLHFPPGGQLGTQSVPGFAQMPQGLPMSLAGLGPIFRVPGDPFVHGIQPQLARREFINRMIEDGFSQNAIDRGVQHFDQLVQQCQQRLGFNAAQNIPMQEEQQMRGQTQNLGGSTPIMRPEQVNHVLSPTGRVVPINPDSGWTQPTQHRFAQWELNNALRVQQGVHQNAIEEATALRNFFQLMQEEQPTQARNEDGPDEVLDLD